MTALRLVALDLSLESPGYAWTTASDDPPVEVLTVQARTDDMQSRVHAIRGMLAQLVRSRPHLVVIEDIFTGLNRQTAIKLAKLHGVVEHDMWHAQLPIVKVHPSYRVIYATGKGNSKKDDVLVAARKKYGRFVGGAAHIRTTDDADALILLAMAADFYGQPYVKVGEIFRRALAGVRWPRISYDPAVTEPDQTTITRTVVRTADATV